MSRENVIFFSYSRDDAGFALKLAQDLRQAGVEIWVDKLDIPPSAEWDEEVEAAMKASGKMLVVLSQSSVASQNVRDEIAFALSSGKRVFPVVIDDCEIPYRLARRQHVDFRGRYEEARAELIKALGGEPLPPPPALNGPGPRSRRFKWFVIGPVGIIVLALVVLAVKEWLLPDGAAVYIQGVRHDGTPDVVTILNSGTSGVDLTRYSLSKRDRSFRFPPGTTVGPGMQVRVLFIDPGDPHPPIQENDVVSTAFRIHRGDIVVLRDSNNNEIHRFQVP